MKAYFFLCLEISIPSSTSMTFTWSILITLQHSAEDLICVSYFGVKTYFFVSWKFNFNFIYINNISKQYRRYNLSLLFWSENILYLCLDISIPNYTSMTFTWSILITLQHSTKDLIWVSYFRVNMCVICFLKFQLRVLPQCLFLDLY